MALIDCSECKKPLSDRADRCPHCGHPRYPATGRKAEGGYAAGCACLAVIILVLGGLSKLGCDVSPKAKPTVRATKIPFDRK